MASNNSAPLPIKSIDLISERLAQAKGVLSLLTADADASNFQTSMRNVMASLWAVETLIEQADAAVQACRS